MEKKFIVLICILLCASFIFAQQQGIQNSESNTDSTEKMVSSNNPENSNQNVIQTSTQTAQENKGENTQIKQITKAEIKTGDYTTENGEKIQVKTQMNNQVQIISKQTMAQTSLEIEGEEQENKTRLQLKLSNGLNSELKIMPDQASATAITALKLNACSEENNCQIEIKEVGQGEKIQAAYEINAQKQVKILGVFQTQMQVKAQINTENGEIIRTEKPWWSFLAIE